VHQDATAAIQLHAQRCDVYWGERIPPVFPLIENGFSSLFVTASELGCVLDVGKRKGGGRVGQELGRVPLMGNEFWCSWLAITDAVTDVVGWLWSDRCNVGWTILTVASCLADSLVSASSKGSSQPPQHLRSFRYRVFIASTA